MVSKEFHTGMHKITHLFLVVLLILPFTLYSQDYQLQKSNPLFEDWRWNTYDVLSDKAVRCIIEGKDNSLWFGTGKGVFHYDGLDWKQYLDENEVISKPVYGLFLSSDNVLYAISVKGICHYDGKNWETDFLFPEEKVLGNEWEILNFEETGNGNILIGVYFGLFELSDKGITLYSTKNQLKNLKLNNEQLSIIYIEESYPELSELIVYDILHDQNKNLWLALEDGTLIKIHGPDINIEKPAGYDIYNEESGILVSRLPIIYEAKDGNIYNFSQSIGGGLNTYNVFDNSWTGIKLSDQFGGDNLCFTMAETSDGVLWIGGMRRIFTYDGFMWKEYKQPELDIPQTRVLITPTSDGSIWITGLLSEVTRIEYETPQWNTYIGVNFQCEDGEGNYWFISGSDKIVSYNEEMDYWNTFDSLTFKMSHPVRIFSDNNNQLWILGSNNGVAAISCFKDGIWMLKTFPELCWGFHPNGVFQSKDGSIWFGANADCGDALWGVVKYSPSKGSPDNSDAWKHYQGTEICEVAYAMNETDYGSILCGYYKGLFEYSEEGVKELHNTLIQDVMKIESIVKDPDKGVWIGTRSHGIIHYINENDWTQYTLENGLASNTVSNILVAKDKTVWITTDKGVSRFDGKKWIRYALPEYFKLGIGSGSLFESSDGSIWYNQNSLEWYRRVFYGLNYTDISSPLISYRIKPEKDSPETVITKYEEKVYYPGNTVVFWEGKDRWNKTKPEELQFSFKLDNGEWSEFTNETNHSFLTLKRGKHRLLVRSRDKFLNIDESPAEISFRVKPPVWMQFWFIALMLILITTIAYLLVSTMRKNQEVQARNAEMNKKNEDLIKQQKEIEEKSKQIMELLEAEKKNRWMNEGLLLIGEIIKKNKDNFDALSKELTIGIINYLKVDYTALFVRNPKNEDELTLAAGYNLSKETLSKKTFRKFEGLTGTCYAEKQTIKVNEISDSYYAESGLGSAKLNSLVLIPVRINQDVAGVYEIASFKSIDDQVIELLERASENIASTFFGIEASMKIEEMYKQSVENTAQLREQEEEMRQNMEELKATQEASKRREDDLLKELEKHKMIEKELKMQLKNKK